MEGNCSLVSLSVFYLRLACEQKEYVAAFKLLLPEHFPSSAELTSMSSAELLLVSKFTASTWMSSYWMSSNTQPTGVSTIAAGRRADDAGVETQSLSWLSRQSDTLRCLSAPSKLPLSSVAVNSGSTHKQLAQHRCLTEHLWAGRS